MNYSRLRLLTFASRRNVINKQNTILHYCSGNNVDIKTEIDNLIKKNKVVIFMKGVPAEPRCGFSNAVVQILRMHGVEYDAHDVLKSDELRQGIKDFSSWPTIPQVYINGEFVGGCDILLQLHKTGDLVKELEKAGIKSLAPEASSEAN